jgi:hypothetical protein
VRAVKKTQMILTRRMTEIINVQLGKKISHRMARRFVMSMELIILDVLNVTIGTSCGPPMQSI